MKRLRLGITSIEARHSYDKLPSLHIEATFLENKSLGWDMAFDLDVIFVDYAQGWTCIRGDIPDHIIKAILAAHDFHKASGGNKDAEETK